MVDKSMILPYVRKRKRRKAAAIISAVSSLILAIFIIIAFCLMHIDRFTISSQSKNLSLSIDETREVLTTELQAPPLLSAADTQYSDIPTDIEEGIGSKNSDRYFAYSFYLLGSGDAENINYSLAMSLLDTSKNIEEAIRVMIIRDGIRTVYSTTKKQILDGEDHTKDPERSLGETTPYWDDKYVALIWHKLSPGEYTKYTIVIWIDGWESVDSMKSRNLFSKFKILNKIRKLNKGR